MLFRAEIRPKQKAVYERAQQGCCPATCCGARGEWEGYWLDHENKSPASERQQEQNSFLVEVAERCATKVNKGCTSTCKYHLCLSWKSNQKLKCCETQLIPPSCENYRKNTAKFIACEVGSPNQILLISFTTGNLTFFIALELINAGF